MAYDNKGHVYGRYALILYGSETGNSQDVADDLGRLCQRLHFASAVYEMNEAPADALLKATFVIFVVGTTGQGEFPRNAQSFWTYLLKKRLPPTYLSRIHFTTFGLGDSSYPKYNWAARKLHKRIELLGGKEIYPRGEGDEQHDEGIDGTFLSWAADLRKNLLASYPLPPGLVEIPSDVLLPPPYKLALRTGPVLTARPPPAAPSQHHMVLPIRPAQEAAKPSQNNTSPKKNNFDPTISTSNTSTTDTSTALDSPAKMRTDWEPEPDEEPETREQLKDEADDHGPAHEDEEVKQPRDILPIPKAFEVTLVKNERITPESHWQDVRLLTFDIPAGKDYQPGDTITIYPKNFPQDVQALIDLQGWTDVADLPLVFKAEAPDYFSAQNLVCPPGLVSLENSTLRELLTHNLDFTAIPKRHFFHVIANYTDDLTHRERLLDFTNPMYTDEFFDYTTRPRRSMLEVLQDFPTVKLPWQWVTSLFPCIRGRQFSICSGGDLQEYNRESEYVKLQILVAIVKYRTVLKKIRQGLCSRYIASLPAGAVLGITKEPNEGFFKAMQDNRDRPIIMVGPGTGVAPCRSFIWNRAAEVALFPTRKTETVLFFGNRNRNADYFFKEEWKDRLLGVKVFAAFSRDQREKIYVQDLIREQGDLINRLIQEGALIIVCGSSGKMPLQVRKAFVEMMELHGRFETKELAEEAFKKIEKEGRYLQETW